MSKKHFTLQNYISILLLKDARHEQHQKTAWCMRMQDADTKHTLFYQLRKHGLFVADGVKLNNGRVIPLYRIDAATYRRLLVRDCPLVRFGFLLIADDELANNAFTHITEPDDLKLKTLRDEFTSLTRKRRAP